MARKQHWKQFLGKSVWSGFSTIARAGSTFVINKLFAVYYGPNGITLLAHFQNLVALLTTLPNGGINVGLIRHLATNKPGTEGYRSFFWAGFWLNLLTFIGSIILFLLFPDFFLERFKDEALAAEQSIPWYVLIGILVLLLLQLFWLSVLLGRQALRPYVWLGLLTSLVSMGVTWWAVGQVELSVALVLFLTGQSVSGLVGTFVLFKKGLIPKIQVRVPIQTYRELGKFMLMAVAMLLGGKFVDFVVREIAIQRFSLYETGLWQSVAKISDSYTIVYVSVLGMVYYPKIAALLPQPQALREYVRSVFFLLVPVIGVGLLFFSFFRDFFIRLLFASEFLPARDLMDYQLLGDFFKMTAWVLSYIITVQARVKLYMITQLGSGLLYIVLVLIALPIFGIEGLPVAHAASYGVYLLFFLYFFRSYFYRTR